MNGVNKVVFITGSSSGIGEQTAYQFARRGASLVLTYHSDQEQGEKVRRECQRLGARDVLLIKLELTSDESIEEAVRQVVDKYGKIEILINNAGTLSQNLLGDKTFEEITNQIKTNLEGPIKLTKLCLPYLKEGIVNIGSRLAFIGRKQLTVYSATKFGIRGFTKALAHEYPNLRIVCVNPGLTATRMGDVAGVPAKKVAQIVCRVAVGEIAVERGSDLNVYDYLENPLKRFIKKYLLRRK